MQFSTGTEKKIPECFKKDQETVEFQVEYLLEMYNEVVDVTFALKYLLYVSDDIAEFIKLVLF